jgi:hypothetical protein
MRCIFLPSGGCRLKPINNCRESWTKQKPGNNKNPMSLSQSPKSPCKTSRRHLLILELLWHPPVSMSRLALNSGKASSQTIWMEDKALDNLKVKFYCSIRCQLRFVGVWARKVTLLWRTFIVGYLNQFIFHSRLCANSSTTLSSIPKAFENPVKSIRSYNGLKFDGMVFLFQGKRPIRRTLAYRTTS